MSRRKRNRKTQQQAPATNQPQTHSGHNPITARSRLASQAGQHFGGDRDLYEVMGYPRYLVPEDYKGVYLRQDIAGRLVDAFPDATWREHPEMRGDQAFVSAWEDLNRRLKIWRTFHRLDRLTGMGHYGVLFLGLDGAERPDMPAQASNYRLLYAQPHSERTAEITRWDDDPQSPRYGKPEMYRITTGTNWTGSGAGQKSLNVHHSRVIHVAEKALEDESIGTPRLERVWNRLMDLDKLLGGSAEMYWQNVAMMMAFMASADTELDPTSSEEIQGQLAEMQNRLRRALTLQGMEAENLAPGLQGANPGEHIDRQLDMIAGAIGVPKRILIGSERGELSSEQDENNWAARIDERRGQFTTPNVIEPFIAKGQALGFLPAGFEEVEWPESDTLGEKGRAEIADRKASAVQRYMGTPGSQMVVGIDEFRGWLGEEGDLPDEQLPDDLPEDDENVTAMWNRRNVR